MHWLKSILYGIVCGLSEFLPISLSGHQDLFTNIFGAQTQNPIADLLVHLTLLACVIIANYSTIMKLRREARLRSRRQIRSVPGSKYDLRLIKNATLPLVILLLLRPVFSGFSEKLPALALCFVLNGILLYVPMRVLQGNKEAKDMSVADGFLVGLLSGLSVFSGISRIGASVSIATVRGADHTKAVNWGILLSIPALLALIVSDLFAIAGGIAEPYAFGHYLLIMIGTFAGGYLGIYTIRTLISKAGFSGFAYYSWGAAMLSIILYMIV